MKTAKYRWKPRRRSRAAAEIETLLVIPILLVILFLFGGMLILGPARLLNVFQSNELAYRDATAAAAPQFSGTPPIDDSLSAALPPDLPSLPNRVHVSDATTPVHIQVGSLNLPAITLENKAAFIAPAWAFSNYPVTKDGAVIQEWMQGYANESLESLNDPLDLSPAWPP